MWALSVVAALLVLVCQSQLALCGGSDVYTLLHRVQSVDYAAPAAAWSPRALVRVSVGQGAEVTPYEAISGASLSVADTDASKTWYQLMLVEGDVRAKSAKEWQSLESSHKYPVAFTKTVRKGTSCMRRANSGCSVCFGLVLTACCAMLCSCISRAIRLRRASTRRACLPCRTRWILATLLARTHALSHAMSRARSLPVLTRTSGCSYPMFQSSAFHHGERFEN